MDAHAWHPSDAFWCDARCHENGSVKPGGFGVCKEEPYLSGRRFTEHQGQEHSITMSEVGPRNNEKSSAALSGGAISMLSGLGILALFMVQNTEDVRVSVLVWDFTWPVWLLSLGSALLGAIVWFGASVVRRHRRRKDRRED
jgi:uncharacterized integral membrane protein